MLGNASVFPEDCWSNSAQKQLRLACLHGEDIRKQHVDISRVYTVPHTLQGRMKAMLSTTKLFTQIFAKGTHTFSCTEF